MAFEKCHCITSLMSGFNKKWFIAGGWAIDLFIGRETREHQDIEIALFRKDQLELKKYLKEWTFKKIINGNFSAWKSEEFLELPVHEIHALNRVSDSKLEILLNEIKHNKWQFRMDLSISCPLESVYSYSETGIPYLNPEIVLLYKVKNTREKDHKDFISIKDHLDDAKKKWLLNAINNHNPEHKWIQLLK